MARTVYGDHDRYLNVYLRPYPGFYFTGDGCKRDNNGYYTITGRVDDVINPSGHRIGTAEVESSLVACTEVSEAAVVGYPHEVKGEGICCFVILGAAYEGSDDLAKRLKNAVRTSIGPFATPDMIIFSDLPKTRSGKIMRRILRKIAGNVGLIIRQLAVDCSICYCSILVQCVSFHMEWCIRLTALIFFYHTSYYH